MTAGDKSALTFFLLPVMSSSYRTTLIAEEILSGTWYMWLAICNLTLHSAFPGSFRRSPIDSAEMPTFPPDRTLRHFGRVPYANKYLVTYTARKREAPRTYDIAEDGVRVPKHVRSERQA
ncbi:hypothetical protein AAG570_001965 [Ranatra chinensis]|uniref:Uncharacterized protein n=1 Tax=Ranatra chinensis TaxID=642074 RepID=A0ABD0YA15_9HEMI